MVNVQRACRIEQCEDPSKKGLQTPLRILTLLWLLLVALARQLPRREKKQVRLQPITHGRMLSSWLARSNHVWDACQASACLVRTVDQDFCGCA